MRQHFLVSMRSAAARSMQFIILFYFRGGQDLHHIVVARAYFADARMRTSLTVTDPPTDRWWSRRWRRAATTINANRRLVQTACVLVFSSACNG